MVSKKSSHRPASKISSAASPAVNAQSTRGSSILLSAFTPSKFQLSLFASITQAFDSQHLRIHDTHTGRLRGDHAFPAGVRLHSLDWGRRTASKSNQNQQSQKSKRKRNVPNGDVSNDDPGATVLAFGTSESDIRLFSIDDSKVVSTLSGGHERGVRNFKFTEDKPSEGWSIGGDGTLVQWDIVKRSVQRTIPLPSSSITALALPVTRAPQILCASQIPIAINSDTDKSTQTLQFDAFRQPVHSLARSGLLGDHGSELFLASDPGRPMNVYDIEQQKLVKTLIAGAEVRSVDLSNELSEKVEASNQILLATTVGGTIELFTNPFGSPSPSDLKSGGSKSRRVNLTSKSDASVRIILPDGKGASLDVVQSSFQGPDVVVAWAANGVDVVFERIHWRDELTGKLSFRGLKEIVRSKKSSMLNSINVHGTKDPSKAYIDESQAVVLDVPTQAAMGNPQAEAISISSEDDADDVLGSEDDKSRAAIVLNHHSDTDPSEKKAAGTVAASDQEMEEVDVGLEQSAHVSHASVSDEGDTEPTFGDLVEARAAADPISIADAIADAGSNALISRPKGDKSSLQNLPSGHSLSTVLTQALRTNDQSLLETCFHETDTGTIRLTIQRMDSSLAGLLLQKLAERVSRPGRYAQLLVWIQWICVAHGGIVASRPDALQKIRNLNSALTRRSHALDSLLLLKGKLDMLDAQVGLRRTMAAQRGRITGQHTSKDDVIYIEGQDESSSSDDDDMTGARPKGKEKVRRSLQELAGEPAEEEAEDKDILMVNGVGSASDDEDVDADEDEDEADEMEEYDEDDDLVNGDGLVDTEAALSDTGVHTTATSEDESDREEDEEDSEMDDFINDEISITESEEIDTPEKPPSKKHKKI